MWPWRGLATFNAIDNPLELPDGSVLIVPAEMRHGAPLRSFAAKVGRLSSPVRTDATGRVRLIRGDSELEPSGKGRLSTPTRRANDEAGVRDAAA